MSVSCLVIRPDYEQGQWGALPRLAAALQTFAQVLEEHDVAVVHLPTDSPGAALDQLDLLVETGTDALVVYIGGHGMIQGREHYTLLDATPVRISSRNAIWTREVATLLALAGRNIILFVDTCFSGESALALDQALKQLAEDHNVVAFGVVSACRAFETAEDGSFVEGLLKLMRYGPIVDPNAWTPKDEAIRLGALVVELDATGLHTRHVLSGGAGELKVIPNLQEQDPPGRVDIKTRLRVLSAGAEGHLIDRSDRFVGRVAVRGRITRWLATANQGMLVVTGGLGTGKSALIGLLARQSTSDPTVCGPDAEPCVAPGTFDVIVHARQKTADEVRSELEVVATQARATVLVDSLDEAVAGESVGIAAQLRALAHRPGIRVVVGTRPSPIMAARLEGHDPLLGELGRAEVVDLDNTEGATADIAELLRLLLTGPAASPYVGFDVADLAEEVAANTAPSFLFAHTAARWLVSRGSVITDDADWRQQVARFGVNEELGSLIDDDLAARFHGVDLVRVRDLLRAVAWAEGLGLPRYTIWPELAEALSPGGASYRDPDITWVLNEAGWYLTEDGEDGQTVYRLFHRALIDYFREQTRHGL